MAIKHDVAWMESCFGDAGNAIDTKLGNFQNGSKPFLVAVSEYVVDANELAIHGIRSIINATQLSCPMFEPLHDNWQWCMDISLKVESYSLSDTGAPMRA